MASANIACNRTGEYITPSFIQMLSGMGAYVQDTFASAITGAQDIAKLMKNISEINEANFKSLPIDIQTDKLNDVLSKIFEYVKVKKLEFIPTSKAPKKQDPESSESLLNPYLKSLGDNTNTIAYYEKYSTVPLSYTVRLLLTMRINRFGYNIDNMLNSLFGSTIGYIAILDSFIDIKDHPHFFKDYSQKLKTYGFDLIDIEFLLSLLCYFLSFDLIDEFKSVIDENGNIIEIKNIFDILFKIKKMDYAKVLNGFSGISASVIKQYSSYITDYIKKVICMLQKKENLEICMKLLEAGELSISKLLAYFVDDYRDKLALLSMTDLGMVGHLVDLLISPDKVKVNPEIGVSVNNSKPDSNNGKPDDNNGKSPAGDSASDSASGSNSSVYESVEEQTGGFLGQILLGLKIPVVLSKLLAKPAYNCAVYLAKRHIFNISENETYGQLLNIDKNDETLLINIINNKDTYPHLSQFILSLKIKDTMTPNDLYLLFGTCVSSQITQANVDFRHKYGLPEFNISGGKLLRTGGILNTLQLYTNLFYVVASNFRDVFNSYNKLHKLLSVCKERSMHNMFEDFVKALSNIMPKLSMSSKTTIRRNILAYIVKINMYNIGLSYHRTISEPIGATVPAGMQTLAEKIGDLIFNDNKDGLNDLFSVLFDRPNHITNIFELEERDTLRRIIIFNSKTYGVYKNLIGTNKLLRDQYNLSASGQDGGGLGTFVWNAGYTLAKKIVPSFVSGSKNDKKALEHDSVNSETSKTRKQRSNSSTTSSKSKKMRKHADVTRPNEEQADDIKNLKATSKQVSDYVKSPDPDSQPRELLYLFMHKLFEYSPIIGFKLLEDNLSYKVANNIFASEETNAYLTHLKVQSIPLLYQTTAEAEKIKFVNIGL